MIKGKRVVLRRKKLEDAWNDYAWKKDPALAHLDATMPISVPFNIYLASYSEELRYHDHSDYRYGIDTYDGAHIGNCSIYNVNYLKGDGELGIVIGDQQCWNQGYGQDAVRTLVNHVFSKGRVHTIYLHTLEENVRAQKCFEKCGFVASRRVTRGIYRFIVMEIRKPVSRPVADRNPVSRSKGSGEG